MIEKRGIIDDQNTRPETPNEKDLEQHTIKRAADTISRPKPPPVPNPNATNASQIADRAKEQLDR